LLIRKGLSVDYHGGKFLFDDGISSILPLPETRSLATSIIDIKSTMLKIACR
jgi:hypothetical protein